MLRDYRRTGYSSDRNILTDVAARKGDGDPFFLKTGGVRTLNQQTHPSKRRGAKKWRRLSKISKPMLE